MTKLKLIIGPVTLTLTLLTIPKVRTHTHGEASFQYYGPRLWNSLPSDLRAAENVQIFKSRLKTHLFNSAFPCPVTC